MDALWTEGFGIVDLPGGKPGKHGDYAEIEVLLPGDPAGGVIYLPTAATEP